MSSNPLAGIGICLKKKGGICVQGNNIVRGLIMSYSFRAPGQAYQTSSSLLTISKVGVLGTILFIRFLSSFVTRLGVMGMQGVNG